MNKLIKLRLIENQYNTQSDIAQYSECKQKKKAGPVLKPCSTRALGLRQSSKSWCIIKKYLLKNNIYGNNINNVNIAQKCFFIT